MCIVAVLCWTNMRRIIYARFPFLPFLLPAKEGVTFWLVDRTACDTEEPGIVWRQVGSLQPVKEAIGISRFVGAVRIFLKYFSRSKTYCRPLLMTESKLFLCWVMSCGVLGKVVTRTISSYMLLCIIWLNIHSYMVVDDDKQIEIDHFWREVGCENLRNTFDQEWSTHNVSKYGFRGFTKKPFHIGCYFILVLQ